MAKITTQRTEASLSSCSVMSTYDGTRHMIMHDITTILNIPLFLWVMYSIFSLRNAPYEGFVEWMTTPFHAIVGILFVIVSFKHFAMELQVVFEDYIYERKVRKFLIKGTKITFLITGVIAIGSLVKLMIN
ncbi:MAG: succinate dehydrogenase, hydrophobic membrane anchor protein [Pseudomonadota bacterium]